MPPRPPRAPAPSRDSRRSCCPGVAVQVPMHRHWPVRSLRPADRTAIKATTNHRALATAALEIRSHIWVHQLHGPLATMTLKPAPATVHPAPDDTTILGEAPGEAPAPAPAPADRHPGTDDEHLQRARIDMACPVVPRGDERRRSGLDHDERARALAERLPCRPWRALVLMIEVDREKTRHPVRGSLQQYRLSLPGISVDSHTVTRHIGHEMRLLPHCAP